MGVTPPPERVPRLQVVRHLWHMHRPQQRHVILTAAIFETDRGRELRIGFTDRHLIHTQCSAIDDYPLLERADDLRQLFLRYGWIELTGPAMTQ